MSGAMGHTLGVLVGLPIAIHMLRNETVDCEGWDIVSRNEWLQAYPLLYGPKQRKRDAEQRGDIDDPVGAALALAGGETSRGRTIGLAAPVPRQTPAKHASTSATATQSPRRKKKRTSRETISPAQASRQHPEFNRLAYLFRQALQSQNLPSAQQAFLKLDSLQIAPGVADQTLMQYATALGRQKRWIDTIRPLAIIVGNGGPLADDACLRLAQIQLRVLKRPDQAVATLNKIVVPEGTTVDAAKRQRVDKRDQLLQSVR